MNPAQSNDLKNLIAIFDIVVKSEMSQQNLWIEILSFAQLQ